MSDTPRTDEASYFSHDLKDCICDTDFARQLERELNAANERIKRLEEAGDALDGTASAAYDDIREHLQVANYNLHGKLNTGDQIDPPNPPQTIHQAGIDASIEVQQKIRSARVQWKKAKEAKP